MLAIKLKEGKEALCERNNQRPCCYERTHDAVGDLKAPTELMLDDF
jgi:hypothetical protein